jgi:hypothetical protein
MAQKLGAVERAGLRLMSRLKTPVFREGRMTVFERKTRFGDEETGVEVCQ